MFISLMRDYENDISACPSGLKILLQILPFYVQIWQKFLKK